MANFLANAISEAEGIPTDSLGMLDPAIFFIMAAVFIVIVLISYVYQSLTLMITAKKLNKPNSWLAWIPIGDFYLKSKMAGMRAWPILLFIPMALGLGILIVSYGGLMVSMMPLISEGQEDVDLDALPPEMSGMAVMSSFGILGGLALFVPFMLAITVFVYIYHYKICSARGRPGWWALIPLVSLVFIPVGLIPVIGSLMNNLVSIAVSVWSMIMWGILAWGK
jgi:hypothetical protein